MSRRPGARRGPAVPAFALAAALCALFAPPAAAQELEGRVTRITLDNGMRFLVVRRPNAPVFSAVLTFKVGSADDRSGETGLAHLFEHLAFKGTSTIGTRDAAKEKEILDALDRVVRDLYRELDRGALADPARLDALRAEMKALTERQRELVVKDELSEILGVNGAEGLNATTSQDFTTYYVNLPANRLELWCLLESARLRDPVLREFYLERDVVMEERRMRIDNQPTGRLYELLLLTAIQAHPYRVPGVGWMSDLERLTRPQAAAFRETYYVPNNAVGTLVGDIDPAQAERLLRLYFGGLKAGPPPPPLVTVEPEQKGERRAEVQYDAGPELMIAFHKPTWPHPDDITFALVDAILTSGRTARLFRRLVTEAQLATEVYSFEAPGNRYPNLFVIGAEPRDPHTPSEVEEGILRELRRLGDEPVEDRELQKVSNQLESDRIYPLRSNGGLASRLAHFEILTGDWKNLLVYQEALRAVTAARIQDVARRIFVPSNRTVVTLRRPEADAPAGGGGR